MHRRAYEFVDDAMPAVKTTTRVVELGSYDVNGSVRPLFAGAKSYTGVDLRSGKGVDQRGDAAEWGEAGCCEVVVCTEVLEHTENAAAIVANAHRLLTPGGTLILTAAGPKRHPHGNDGGALGDEFYRNIEPKELAKWFESAGFSDYDIDLTDDGEDVQAVARKAAKTK